MGEGLIARKYIRGRSARRNFTWHIYIDARERIRRGVYKRSEEKELDKMKK